MKKTYISPIIKVDEAMVEDFLVMSVQVELSGEGGSEEYVKEQTVKDVDVWNKEW